MQTSDITATAAEITSIDAQIDSQSAAVAQLIRDLIKECGATFRRQAISPRLQQDAQGEGIDADWKGLRFFGKRAQDHKGQSGTWQWSIGGQSCYICEDGMVRLLSWDGEATDFGGCKGYMDTFTSELIEDTLEDHLSKNPESAQQIVDRLRKAVTEDKKAAAGRLERMNAIVSSLH